MRTWAKGSAPAAFLALGVMTLGSGAAWADTDGSHSIGGGNQVNIPVTLPIDISGNAVAVAGDAAAGSQGGAAVLGGAGGAGGNTTSGAHSILGGNQVVAPITAPVDVCGNAVAVLGRSRAGCQGGAAVKGSGRTGGAGGNVTSGRHSILGGNQVVAPITAPVNLCGNAVAIFGDSVAGCRGGSYVNAAKATVRAGGNRTSGRSSILGGNQVVVPITVPVNVCGNSVAALGTAFSGCHGGSSVGTGRHHRPTYGGKGSHGWKGHWHRPGSTGHDSDTRYVPGSGGQVFTPYKPGVKVRPRPVGWGSGGNRTSGTSSIGGGNQVVAPITLPVDICGNSVAVLGGAFSGCKGGATVHGGWGRGGWGYGGYWTGGGAGGNRTSGAHSILGGNQVVAPITAPINVCGNAVAVLGHSRAGCKGGASVLGGVGAGGNVTSGRHSILGGNQVVAPIIAPINVCGNAVAVLGDAAAGCLGGARVGGAHTWGHGYYRSVSHGSVMPAMPAAPLLSGMREAAGARQRMTAAAAPSGPVVEQLPSMLGMPDAPKLPAVPTSGSSRNSRDAGKPASAVAGALGGSTRTLPTKSLDGATRSLPVAGSLTDAGRSLPVADLGQATDALPLKNLGLMSAEQPTGLTGMNPGSFAALVLGAIFAASASLFAVTRRFRFGRK
ncbi:chaplin [Microbispora sp. RL4-1S]|uniref:Chaplin n=1 Tax=Microbispora oryzae TaxID=2806554 RepID=A0A941AHV2_9ACTN|nr:chaplin family protein [Microbispora oryzae]MBP2704500.1 chaplin [Microbispora oryzae]